MSFVSHGPSVERMVSGRSSNRGQQSNVLDRKYMFEYDVGLWAYGRVQVVRERQTDQLKVCKTVSLREARIRDVEAAARRLIRLRDFGNDHVTKVTDVLQDAEYFYVIMEHCTGGDLAEWSIRLHENNHWLQEHTVAEYIRQLLIALHHGHGSRICHRDLRPSSLLLTSKMPDAQVKVADFGIADIVDPTGALARDRGTCPFAAPEIYDPVLDVHGRPVPAGPAADLWSVGAIAHYLLAGCPPPRPEVASGAWAALARVGSRALDLDGDLDPQMQDRSPMSRDFVRRLLSHQANERPTAAAALQLPWMESCFSLNPAHWATLPQAADLRGRLLSYMLATLIMPAKVEYTEFFQLRSGFLSADADRDGFVSLPVAHKLLRDRGAPSLHATMALDAVDVKGTGAIDLAATAAAAAIAFGGFCQAEGDEKPKGPSDFVPRLIRGFFELFGDPQRAVSSVPTTLERQTLSVVREAEAYLGVCYEEILEPLADQDSFDAEALLECLLDSRGRGTPLAGADAGGSDSESEESAWGESFGVGRVRNLFGGLFATCGTQQDSRQACEAPICNVNMRHSCMTSPDWGWSGEEKRRSPEPGGI